MTTDPVCGMTVDENSAPAKATFEGQTYYFCSTNCKTKFEREPRKYVNAGQQTPAAR